MPDYPQQPTGTGFSFAAIVNAIVNLTSVMSKLTSNLSSALLNVNTTNSFTAVQTFTKPPVIAAGSNNAASVLPEGNVNAQTSAAGVGNVGAGETVLFTYTLPGNTLDLANRGLRFTAFGTIANNANAKTIRFYFGSSVFSVTAPTSVAASWFVEGWLFKTGASAQTMCFRSQAGATVVNPSMLTGAETDTAGIVIKVTGQATSNNDILANAFAVEYQN